MAILRVSPTRMQLKKLKKRLATATRGHKLLKDKNDELMKQFLDIVKVNLRLRNIVEEKVLALHESFTAASAEMSPEMLGQALMLPKQSVTLEVGEKNIMSVRVPVYDFKTKFEGEGILPYGFANTSSELDDAVNAACELLPDLLALAANEKSTSLLAAEIEKTRRRVNALEHVLIPQFRDTIKYISMKLEENERGNITRLMKVKDMMLAEVRKSEEA
jgi:V/A-type H+-transporting ATPase subunit D